MLIRTHLHSNYFTAALKLISAGLSPLGRWKFNKAGRVRAQKNSSVEKVYVVEILFFNLFQVFDDGVNF